MPSFQEEIKSRYFQPFCQALWGKFQDKSKDSSLLKQYFSAQTSDWEAPLTTENIGDALDSNDSKKLETLLGPLALSHMRNIDSGENLGAIKLEDLGLSKVLSISDNGNLGDNTAESLKKFCGDDYSGILQVSNQNGNCHQVNSSKSSQAFALHSIAKVFTGVLICEMIAKGIISEHDLNTPPLPLNPEVVKKLPEKDSFRGRIKTTTLHQAMTHTSGLQDYLGTYLSYNKQSLVSGKITTQNEPEDFLQFVEDSVASFEPGEGRFYSNTGILLSGLAAKNLYNIKVPEDQKKTYNEMLQEIVLQPAGISSFFISIPKVETITNP